MGILLSAVVCTHNRARYLERALQSLIDQRTPRQRFEIIVVDNGSTDGTRECVEGFRGAANLRYAFEPKLGLAHARNRGGSLAQGRVIAYLDDDAVASPAWIDGILEVFASVTPRPGCVGGKTFPLWEADRPSWLSDWLMHGLAIVDWTETPRALLNLRAEWLVGANLAVSADLFRAVGGFTPHLDRIGKHLLSSGDVFFQKEIMRRGFTCFYDPAVAVQHHIARSRLSQSWFLRRYYWQGVSDAVMEILEEEPSPGQRLRRAAGRAASLLRSRQKVELILFPTRHPGRFTQRCFALIELGHVRGLFRGLQR